MIPRKWTTEEIKAAAERADKAIETAINESEMTDEEQLIMMPSRAMLMTRIMTLMDGTDKITKTNKHQRTVLLVAEQDCPVK